MKDSVRVYFEKLYQPDLLPERMQKEYEMLSCLKHTKERQIYLLVRKVDGLKFILKCGTGLQAELLDKEYDLMERLHDSRIPEAEIFFYEKDTAYLVRSFIEGRTLLELVENFGELSEREAAEVVWKVAGIIEYMHSQKPSVICRDIKPQNIVMTSNGDCYLIDLDTARIYRAEAEEDTLCMGTKKTASPEQFGFCQSDERTDIYGLGMLLLFLVTGEYDKKSKAFRGLSGGMRHVIEKCTRFAPTQRYSSVESLKRALKRRRKQRTYYRYGLVGGLCLAGLAAGFVLGNRWGLLSKETNQKEGVVQQVKSSVTFENPSIEAGVKKVLHKSENEPVSQREAEQVTALILCGDRVFTSWEEHEAYHNDFWYEVEAQTAPLEAGDFSDLKNLKNLRVLVLDNQGIEKLPDLSGLELQQVSLCNNQLMDVSALSKQPHIRTLWLNGNPLSDISPLKNLTELTELDVSNTQAEDMTALRKVPLKNLYCAFTNVDNKKLIEEFKNLSRLRISHADEETVRMVSKLTNLRMLGMYESQVTTMNVFQSMKLLESLDVSGCESLTDLEGVQKLFNLNYLGLSGTSITRLPKKFQLKKLEIIDLHGIILEEYIILKDCPKLNLIYTGIEEEERIKQQLSGKNVRIQVF